MTLDQESRRAEGPELSRKAEGPELSRKAEGPELSRRADYRIFETETYQADIARMGKSGLAKIRSRLEEHVYPQLRREPHHGPQIKKLKNWDPPAFRYRVGAWRFFYEIDEKEKIVFLTVADHRSRAYK